LPHATLDASEAVNRFNLRAQLGVQLTFLPPNIGPFQSIHAGTSFQIPVFDLTLLQKYQASGHRLEASRDDVRAIREQTTLLTVSEYSAHLRAMASVAAAQSRVDLATRLLSQAQDLWKDGVATKIDVSRADVRVSEEKQKLIDAQTDQQTTNFALKRILNLSDQMQLVFADDKDFYSTPDLTVDDSVAGALAKRPEILSLSATAKAAASDRKAAVSQVLPTFTAGGKWDEEGARLTTLAPGYEYRLELKMPLFTGGRLKAEREAARIAEHKSQLQLADERNRVTEQTRDRHAELQAALQQVQLAKQQIDLAKQELDLAEGRFQAGVTDNIEVIAGQDDIARANDAQIAAFYRYSLARAELARAVGASEQEYTQP
jgi:outer membrane protein TolC